MLFRNRGRIETTESEPSSMRQRGGAGARGGIDEDPENGAITQTHHMRNLNRLEQRPGLVESGT